VPKGRIEPKFDIEYLSILDPDAELDEALAPDIAAGEEVAGKECLGEAFLSGPGFLGKGNSRCEDFDPHPTSDQPRRDMFLLGARAQANPHFGIFTGGAAGSLVRRIAHHGTRLLL